MLDRRRASQKQLALFFTYVVYILTDADSNMLTINIEAAIHVAELFRNEY